MPKEIKFIDWSNMITRVVQALGKKVVAEVVFTDKTSLGNSKDDWMTYNLFCSLPIPNCLFREKPGIRQKNLAKKVAQLNWETNWGTKMRLNWKEGTRSTFDKVKSAIKFKEPVHVTFTF